MERFVIAAMACVVGGSAVGQTAQTVSLAALNRDPTPYLNHAIRVTRLGCFQMSETGYRCTTYGGAYVLFENVAPGSLAMAIKAGCGGLVEAEDDPTCLFDAVFVPSSVGKGPGSIVKGDQSIDATVWMVHATMGTLTRHR